MYTNKLEKTNDEHKTVLTKEKARNANEAWQRKSVGVSGWGEGKQQQKKASSFGNLCRLFRVYKHYFFCVCT